MKGAFSEIFRNAPGFTKPERVQEKSMTSVKKPIKKTNQVEAELRAKPLKNLKISDEIIKEAHAKALGFEPQVQNPELNLDDGIYSNNSKFNKVLGFWKEQEVTTLRHQSSQSVSGLPDDYNDPLYSSVEKIQEAQESEIDALPVANPSLPVTPSLQLLTAENPAPVAENPTEVPLLPDETPPNPPTAGVFKQLHPGIVELGQTMAHGAVAQGKNQNPDPADNQIDALPVGKPSLPVTPSLQLLATENPAPVAENPAPVSEDSSPAASMTFSEKKAFQDLCSKECFKEMLQDVQKFKTGEPSTSSSAAAAAVLKSATPIINASRRASQLSPSDQNLVGDGEGVLQDEASSGSDNTMTGQEMADHVLSYALSFRQRVMNLPEQRPPNPTPSVDDLYRFYNHEKTKLQGIEQDGLFLLDFSSDSRKLIVTDRN